jgi:O-methyltransferase
MQNHITNMFSLLSDVKAFSEGLQKTVNAIQHPSGIYASDNLFTYHRNLSFTEDEALMTSFKKHASTPIEQAILWRTAVVLWGVRNGLRLSGGDFVECGCYTGTTVRIICDAVNFAEHTECTYYLYDLFDIDQSTPSMPSHSAQLASSTKARFAEFPNVKVTQGKIPEILADVAPKKIAFMHIDMNNVDAEIGALDVLFDRMLPGALLVLDDYGWLGFRKQKLAEDPWFAQRGYHVLELPTGQGLVIK